MNNENLLRQLNEIVRSIQGLYNDIEIKEIRDRIVSDVVILATKDTTNRTVIFLFDKHRVLSSIVRQNNTSRSFRYDNIGIAKKNCYNVFLKSYKDKRYTISIVNK